MSFYSKGSYYDQQHPNYNRDAYKNMEAALNNDDIFACADYEDQLANQFKNQGNINRIS
jgi:hypothetical protein